MKVRGMGKVTRKERMVAPLHTLKLHVHYHVCAVHTFAPRMSCSPEFDLGLSPQRLLNSWMNTNPKLQSAMLVPPNAMSQCTEDGANSAEKATRNLEILYARVEPVYTRTAVHSTTKLQYHGRYYSFYHFLFFSRFSCSTV